MKVGNFEKDTEILGFKVSFFILKSLNFLNLLIFTAALCLGVYSASNRNEYQKQENRFLGSRVRPAHKAANFIAICEPIV
jgi:hypothetical protein